MRSAADRILLLNRRTRREVFQHRFSAERMASDYLAIYKAVLSEQIGFAAAKIEELQQAEI
jgi:hypothetical protein